MDDSIANLSPSNVKKSLDVRIENRLLEMLFKKEKESVANMILNKFNQIFSILKQLQDQEKKSLFGVNHHLRFLDKQLEYQVYFQDLKEYH